MINKILPFIILAITSCSALDFKKETYNMEIVPTKDPIIIEISDSVLIESIDGHMFVKNEPYKYKTITLDEGEHMLTARYVMNCSDGWSKTTNIKSTLFFKAEKGHKYRIFAHECSKLYSVRFTLFDDTEFEQIGNWYDL